MESQSKGWLWRKKSGEKQSAAAEKLSLPLKPDDDEIQNLLTEREELENSIKILNDKLDSALLDSNAKDSLATNHAKTAKEAMEGRERAESRAKSLKQELDDALEQRAAGEERLAQLDAALKECMQQLRFVREEQEKRIHDAVAKASMEFDESRMILEEKLAETGKRLAKLGVENTQLSKALLAKEKVIEELNKQKAQLESDLKDLTVSLEFTEKDNGSLKYEVRVLEKELEIRNEEREFNRRTADATHKQQLESVKKIAKLESECQRLRLLVRKRLPGPASMAKMRSEVEILGRDSVESRRRRSISGSSLIMDDDYGDEKSATKTINNLAEQLSAVEEQNKALVEALGKKESELQSSRAMFARAASRLSPSADSRIYESPKWRTSLELSKLGLVPHDISLSSVSEAGSDDKVSSAESWPCALMSESEHFKHGKQNGSMHRKSVGASDMDLMDDFVEMERLAIVSVDKEQLGSPQVSSTNSSAAISPLKPHLNETVTGMEIVPVLDSGSRQPSDTTSTKGPSWLQEILRLVLEQNRVTERQPDEILEEMRTALANAESTNPIKDADGSNSANSTPISGYLLWKSTESNGAANDIDVPLSDLGKSVSKIVELIEGIAIQNPGYTNTSESLSRKDSSSLPYKTTETPTGYTVRIFQWKTSELSDVLQQFVHTCYDLLSGKCNVTKFAQELTSALDWITNHCFSLQDVSSMKEAIKKHLDWDSRSEGDQAEVGIIGNQKHVEKDEVNKSNSDLADMLSAKKALEERMRSATEKSESLTTQVQESEKTGASLQSELGNARGSRGSNDAQSEAHKVMKEDLDTQLVMAKAELNDARRKLSSLEVELENRNSCCEELEATCVDLQLQLESVTGNATPNHEVHPEENQLRTNWEIATASEKLAECQETILNLGKQLKALASPTEAAIFDKVISKPDEVNTTTSTAAIGDTASAKLTSQRSSLLDRMLAEDTVKATANAQAEQLEKILNLNKSKHHTNDDGVTVNSLAIVPGRKHGIGGMWRKLLRKKKKSAAGQKPPIAFPK